MCVCRLSAKLRSDAELLLVQFLNKMQVPTDDMQKICEALAHAEIMDVAYDEGQHTTLEAIFNDIFVAGFCESDPMPSDRAGMQAATDATVTDKMKTTKALISHLNVHHTMSTPPSP